MKRTKDWTTLYAPSLQNLQPTLEGQRDIGFYFGPFNVQIEHYDQGITQEPKPGDEIDDPDPRRVMTYEEKEKLLGISDLTLVERTKSGLPIDVYVARNVHRYTYDPRVYIAVCDCEVHGRSDLNGVAIAPRVRLVRGFFDDSAQFSKLGRWIKLNRALLLRHWHQEIDADETLRSLKPLI